MARLPDLSTVMNFRDLGGAPVPGGVVARGRLFRSGQLSEVSDEVARQLAETLRIGTYIDFRADADIARDGEPAALLRRGVAWSRHPFELSETWFSAIHAPSPSDWQELYVRSFARVQRELCAAIQAIALASEPVVFGCWAGKDRTGIAAALVLALLGVEAEWIGYDYAQTRLALQPFKSRFAFIWRAEPDAELNLWAAHSGTQPQAVLGFLQHIRVQYGSVQRALGLPDGLTARLRERYLA